MHFNNAKEKSISWVSFQVYDVAYRGLSTGRGCPSVGFVRFAKHVKYCSPSSRYAYEQKTRPLWF